MYDEGSDVVFLQYGRVVGAALREPGSVVVNILHIEYYYTPACSARCTTATTTHNNDDDNNNTYYYYFCCCCCCSSYYCCCLSLLLLLLLTKFKSLNVRNVRMCVCFHRKLQSYGASLLLLLM